MELKIAKLEDQELSELALGTEFAASKVIIELATDLRDRLRVANETNPKHSPEDLTEDWVAINGAIHALNTIIDAPAKASEEIIKRR